VSGTYSLSSVPPLTSLFGVEPVTLLVGVEDDPGGGIRAYLGARWKGVYLHVTEPDAVEQFRRAWGSGGHVWMSPVPPPDLLHKAETP
jgi:hypothetical protein